MKYAPPLDTVDPNGSYVDANPTAGIQGSIVPAAALEPGMREIVKVIEDAGLTPSDSDNTQLAQAIELMIAKALGTISNDLIYPGAFHDFYEQAPPAGWMVRDGALISSASTVVPKLYEALQLADNAFMLKSEAQWQALSSVAGGIGGVPFFVLNIGANTIRLPDTRGDYVRNAGSAFLQNVGDWHEDAITSKLKGTINNVLMGIVSINGSFLDIDPTGAFEDSYMGAGTQFHAYSAGGYTRWGSKIDFNPSSIVPTADENRTRAFAMLGCVYVGV